MNWFSNIADGLGDLFNVGSTIGASNNMKADDVLKTKSVLNAVGHYKAPDFGITEIPDTPMIEGLKNFQASNGLKVDGVMKPKGPTENALAQTLANQGVSATDLLEKAKTSSIHLDQANLPSTPAKTSWSAQAAFGGNSQSQKKPRQKIDPTTGLVDPLAFAPKGKMPTQKQWDEVAKLQPQEARTVIVPKGDSVEQRLLSMMMHPDYAKKRNPAVVKHIQGEFKRAFPGNMEYDETGKMVQPIAAIMADDIRAYDSGGELQAMNFQPKAGTASDEAFTYTFSDDGKKTSQVSSYKAKSTGAKGRNERRENLRAEGDDHEWEAGDFIKMLKDNIMGVDPTQTHLRQYKDEWVKDKKDTIKKMAGKYNLPPEMLAGLAWSELGGEPDSLDKIWNLGLQVIPYKPSNQVSAGDVSIQLRHVAKMEGLDPEKLTFQQEQQLIRRLQNEDYNLEVVARHIADMRDTTFPNLKGKVLNKDQIKRLGYMYNMGKDHPMLQPGKDLSEADQSTISNHGLDLMRKIERMRALIE
jgi:hypothetical protein